MRNEQVAGLSDLLYQWFEKARDKGLPISDDILRYRAKEIAKGLSGSAFKASNSFLYKWLKLYNISLRKITGEALGVKFSSCWRVKNTILNEIYNEFPLSDIYNVDETGLFYKHLSAYTYHKRGLNYVGYKEDKKLVSILLWCNALVTEKLIVI